MSNMLREVLEWESESEKYILCGNDTSVEVQIFRTVNYCFEKIISSLLTSSVESCNTDGVEFFHKKILI